MKFYRIWNIRTRYGDMTLGVRGIDAHDLKSTQWLNFIYDIHLTHILGLSTIYFARQVSPLS